MRKTRRVKKQSEADLKRTWFIDPKVRLRYSGIAGVFWYYLSIQVRQEDFEKYKGKCVSCETVLADWKDGDCGHLRASSKGGYATRFMRKNLALQCKPCNNPKWSPDSSARFALETDRRWGIGTAEYIFSIDKFQKEMKRHEYEEAIRALPSYVIRSVQ